MLSFCAGVLDSARNLYLLDYEGVSFVFPLRSQTTAALLAVSSGGPVTQTSWKERAFSVPHEALEKEIESSLEDSPRSFVFSRAFIHSSDSLCEAAMQRSQAVQINTGHVAKTDASVQSPSKVCVYIHQGVYLLDRRVFIGFHTTLQDCWSDLGQPDLEYDKETSEPSSDFFLNYFALGFDLLIDGDSQRHVFGVFHSTEFG